MSKSETHVSLWGGRFSGGPSQALAALSVSTHFDFRLAHVDIAGSHAHADELHRVGLLTDQECADMHDALARLDADVASGAFVPAPDDEDPRPTTKTFTPRLSVASSSEPERRWVASSVLDAPATIRLPRSFVCTCARRPVIWPGVFSISLRLSSGRPCTPAMR